MSDDPRDEGLSPEDRLAAMRAELDQGIALSPEVARAARGLFDAFVEKGFTENQALYLTAVQMHGTPGEAPS